MLRRTAIAVAVLAAVVATLAAISITLGAAAAAATARAALGLAPGSELWMEGKSTIHEWQSRTHSVAVVFTRATQQPDPKGGAAIEALVRANGVRGVDVQIPVASLHSDKKGLDKNMLKALRADTYPTIHFRMERYTVVSRPSTDTLKLKIAGALTVSGTERHITLDATARRSDKGEWIDGTEPLLMTDYGIKPPTMMLGRLKVADSIVIHYHLLLASDTGVLGAKLHGSR